MKKKIRTRRDLMANDIGILGTKKEIESCTRKE